jgi:hypothetical protein
MRSDWASLLITIYRECRNSLKWSEILECHDEEDKEYFRMLESKKNKMMMACFYDVDGKLIESVSFEQRGLSIWM